jgi:hypothetical protein
MKFNYSPNYYDVWGFVENEGKTEIVHIKVWGNGFKKDLEKIVLESGIGQSEQTHDYARRDTRGIIDYVNSTNDDRLSMVNYLGPNILGIYDPADDKAYVVKGLSPALEEYVKQHEFGHRLAVYLGIPPTEEMADAYATAVTGYNPMTNVQYSRN